MPKKILEQAVSSPDDGATWDFQCPGVAGSPCGPFRSTGWPTKKVALARGQEHFDEHKAGPELLRLRTDMTLALNNVPGYEDIDVDAKSAEHDELLATARMSTLEDFRAKHGLGVDPDSGLAVKLEDLA